MRTSPAQLRFITMPSRYKILMLTFDPPVPPSLDLGVDLLLICPVSVQRGPLLWLPALLGIPIREGLAGLDRARAEAELEWWQRQVRQYQQARRSLAAHDLLSYRHPSIMVPINAPAMEGA